MQAVIMAGGKGTRLAALTKDEIPKPMVPVAGKPLLLWQVERLKENEITDIIMVIGHLGDKIKEYFGDGEKFGVSIRYFEETEPLGTAGSFYYLKDMIHGERFIMMSGDLFFDIDFQRMIRFHEEKGAVATLFVHPNGHPFDSDLLVLDKDDKITAFDSKHNVRDYWYKNCVNAGIFVFEKKICDYVPEPVKRNLENDVIKGMLEAGEPIYGYCSPEYVKDVGTVDRVNQTLADIERGVIAGKCLKTNSVVSLWTGTAQSTSTKVLYTRKRTLHWKTVQSTRSGRSNQSGKTWDRYHKSAGGCAGALRD